MDMGKGHWRGWTELGVLHVGARGGRGARAAPEPRYRVGGEVRLPPGVGCPSEACVANAGFDFAPRIHCGADLQRDNARGNHADDICDGDGKADDDADIRFYHRNRVNHHNDHLNNLNNLNNLNANLLDLINDNLNDHLNEHLEHLNEHLNEHPWNKDLNHGGGGCCFADYGGHDGYTQCYHHDQALRAE